MNHHGSLLWIVHVEQEVMENAMKLGVIRVFLNLLQKAPVGEFGFMGGEIQPNATQGWIFIQDDDITIHEENLLWESCVLAADC